MSNKNLAIMLILIAIIIFGYTASVVDTASIYPTDSEDSLPLPIIMYHGFLKDPKYGGKYVISPQKFESDIKYIKKKGYTPINTKDLIDYVYNGKNLPEKPIMITIDDGYYNNYLYAYPIIKKENVKIIISPVTYYTEKYTKSDSNHPNYSHITWAQAKEMADSNLVELQNHSHNLHTYGKARKGAQKNKDESSDAYKKMLYKDLKTANDLINKYTGKNPTAFIFPFGSISKDAREVIEKLNYKASFSCEEGINKITKDPEVSYLLKRYNRPNNISTEQYFKKILK